MKFFPWVLAATTLVAACTDSGPNFNVPVTIEEMESPGNYSNRDPGPVALRRLTRAQFKNSIRYLLGDEVVIPKLSEPDSNVGGLLSVGASITTFSPRGVESLETVAYSVAAQAVEVGTLQRYLSCSPGGVVDEGCAQSFVENFGRLAWRRSLNAEEISALTQIATDAADTLDDFNRGLEFATAAILQSPYFLFRVEIGEEVAGSEQRQFSPLELASRLSFFLWNSTPDEELLNAAENGSLATREGLFAQASRLLEASQAKEGIRNFFTEQYELYELDHYSKDPTIFEHFQRDLGINAREETLKVLEHIVFDDNADFRDIMTTDHSYINPRLAALYAIPAPVEEGYGYVKLPKSSNRVGLLGHASFLGLHSHSVSSSATLRGKAIRTILLCQSIPLPPVNVDTSIPEPSGTTLTLRDRVAEHLENPSCVGCHQMTDPIGLGLENFDGIGRWRDTDHGALIDASGDLDGDSFETMKGLAEAIRNHPAFAPCVVKTLSRYAIGRKTTRKESAWLQTLSERFEFHGFRLKRIIMEIVMSPLFQKAGALKEVEEQS